MLYFITTWTILIGISLAIGTAILNFVHKNSFEKVGDQFIVSVWLGLVLFGVILLSLSIVVPLSPLVGLVTAVILVILSLFSAKNRSQLKTFYSFLSPYLIINFVALAWIIAALMTQPVRWIDTGLYHVGVIRWLAEYGAVVGVSLIHLRLGWPSSWFALATPFSPISFDLRTCAVINGFVLLITCIHFFISLIRILKNQRSLPDWFATISLSIILAFLTVPSLFNKKNIIAEILISPSPDIPVIVLTFVIAWIILLIYNDRDFNIYKSTGVSTLNISIIPLILSLAAVTIKLTAIPLFVVTGFFYLTYKGFHSLKIIWGSLVTFLILTPMIIYGIVTSGCPLPPSKLMCLNLPWSPQFSRLDSITKSVGIGGWWKQWYTSPPVGKNYWLWLLDRWVNSDRANLLIILLIILSILAGSWLFIIAYRRKKFDLLWIVAIGITGTTFVFYQSPLFRFFLGYILIIPCVGLAMYCYQINFNDKNNQLYSRLFLILNKAKNFKNITLLVAGFSIILLVNLNQSFLVLPPQLPKPKLVESQVNDITYLYPFDNNNFILCWASKLPCALGPIKQNIKLRDPEQGIKKGFVYGDF